jgi:hypothetical protein
MPLALAAQASSPDGRAAARASSPEGPRGRGLAPGRTSPTGTRYGPGVLRTRETALGWSLRHETRDTRHRTQHSTLAHAGEQHCGHRTKTLAAALVPHTPQSIDHGTIEAGRLRIRAGTPALQCKAQV